ncbi:MAG: hypothetical protein H5U07_10685 [Candidatus Aminicenantes bacterium]|nr:hypothetical protein [Candidatus Aminicenantes bacterium]
MIKEKVIKEKDSQFKNKPSIQGVTGDRKRERLLKLSLPALVKGQNALGRSFEEKTEIKAISAEQAHLFLRNPVQVGSQLLLIINVPATVMLLHPIRMELSGQVSKVEMKKIGRRNFQQLVLKLQPHYKIRTQVASNN